MPDPYAEIEAETRRPRDIDWQALARQLQAVRESARSNEIGLLLAVYLAHRQVGYARLQLAAATRDLEALAEDRHALTQRLDDAPTQEEG